MKIQPYLNLDGDCAEDAGEARRIFDALSDGAQVQMSLEATFWSPGFGMLAHRWSTPWMVNTMPDVDQR